jgi:hypothetical protein
MSNEQNAGVATPAPTPTRKQITTAEVKELLDQGFTREEIGEKFGLNKKETKHLFQHPELKGKKVKSAAKGDSFEIVSSGLPITEIKPRVWKEGKPKGNPNLGEYRKKAMAEKRAAEAAGTATTQGSGAAKSGSMASE